jgi:type VI secretion system protein ImpK
MSDYGDLSLLAHFREFYAEIIRLKPLAVVGTAVGLDEVARIPTQPLTPEADNSVALVRVEPGGYYAPALDFPVQFQPAEPSGVSAVVWNRLVTLFQRQAITAWNNGGSYGAETYKRAQYVMVALADEIFLQMKWEGQRAWVLNLLEAKIFRSHAAGQHFFDKLDRLLREQNPLDRDLAQVYLMALSLGFRGKYYGMDDRGTLARYRQQLFTFICGREPDLNDETRYAFPEAYYHNVREESRRKLSDPRKWIVVLCLVIIVYTAATQAFWMQFTQELNTVNQSIMKLIGELKAQP